MRRSSSSGRKASGAGPEGERGGRGRPRWSNVALLPAYVRQPSRHGRGGPQDREGFCRIGRRVLGGSESCNISKYLARRGGRARLKASDSKSDRGASPSGVQILSPPPLNFPPRGAFAGLQRPRVGQPIREYAVLVRRGGRVAEGAALEMPCRGNSTVGSNPTPSAKLFWSGVQEHAGWREGVGGEAPTKQMAPYRQPAPVGRARRGGSGAL